MEKPVWIYISCFGYDSCFTRFQVAPGVDHNQQNCAFLPIIINIITDVKWPKTDVCRKSRQPLSADGSSVNCVRVFYLSTFRRSFSSGPFLSADLAFSMKEFKKISYKMWSIISGCREGDVYILLHFALEPAWIIIVTFGRF